MWKAIRFRLRSFLRPSRVIWEIDDEFDFHLEQRENELRSGGADPLQARRLALKQFGHPGRHRQYLMRLHRIPRYGKTRDVMMERIVQDIRFGLRMLAKSPGFALTALVALALGIGANTAMFSLINHVLIEPLPFAEVDRLVMVFETDRHNGTTSEGASVPDFFDFKERNHVFDALIAFFSGPMTLNRPGETPERLTVANLSHEALPLLGHHPLLGRGLAPEEDQPEGPRAVVLSEEVWRTRFGSRQDVLGEAVALNGVAHTIVGVMPNEVSFPTPSVQMWRPLRIVATSAPRGNHFLLVVGRLKPGISLEQASADMTAIAAQLEEEFPQDNAARGVRLVPITEQVVGNIRPVLYILWSAVLAVLLIACVNVANLMLARASARSREVAVRSALGAGRWRLAQQFLVESLLLALAAAFLGIGLAYGGIQALIAWGPSGIPRLSGVTIDLNVLVFTLLIATLAGIGFGVFPALTAVQGRDGPALNEAGRGNSASRSSGLAARLLVTIEVALAVVLVIGAGLLMRSLWHLQAVDPGFRSENVVKVDFQLPASKYPQDFQNYPNWPEVHNFIEELSSRVVGLPGVESAALGLNHPLNAGWTTRFTVDGRPPVDVDKQTETRIRPVSPAYFSTLGIRLLQGRPLNERDRTDAPPVIIVNQAMATRYFPAEDPVGKRITFWGTSREIVGVAADVKFQGLASPTSIAVYPPLSQTPMAQLSLMVKSSSRPSAMIEALKAQFRQMDPDLAIFGAVTMDELLGTSVSQPRFNAWMLGLFALTALLLALVGIFGVLSQSVQRRRHEMGVRLALGARPSDLLRLVVGQGMLFTVTGTVIGLLAAVGLTRLLQGLLHGISPLDVTTFVAVTLVLGATAMLACWVPARRASRSDPLVTLRCE